MKYALDYTIGLEENASQYFDKAKKAKKKLEGLKIALAHTEKKIADSSQKADASKEQTERDLKIREASFKKKWYEKFRWFYTSSGHLAVGGRDAHTNEGLIKKHMENTDMVFHTDMAGSPFFLLKLEGDSATPEEITEVALATVCFSRAWQKGLGGTAVFWVKPDQVSKDAQAGESLATGAFMIYGKTNYVDIGRMALAIGLHDFKLICGPVPAIKSVTSEYAVVEQGDKKPSDTAKMIRKKLKGGQLDDIIRCLPTGGLRVV